MKEKYECKYRMMSEKRIKEDIRSRIIKGGILTGLSFGLTIGLTVRWLCKDIPGFVFPVLGIMFGVSQTLTFIKRWWIIPSVPEILESLGLEENRENLIKYARLCSGYFLGSASPSFIIVSIGTFLGYLF